MSHAHRSDDLSIPVFHTPLSFKPKVLKPQHQLAVLWIVLLHNVFEHVQRGRPNGDQQWTRVISCENGCHLFFCVPLSNVVVSVCQIAFVDPADAQHFTTKGLSRANKCQGARSRCRVGRIVESNETSNIYDSRGLIDTIMRLP